MTNRVGRLVPLTFPQPVKTYQLVAMGVVVSLVLAAWLTGWLNPL